MKKQTALQWLYAKLDQMPTRDEVCDLVYQIEEQAKAMEKEQMRLIYEGLLQNVGTSIKESDLPTFEQYYNEIYGGDK